MKKLLVIFLVALMTLSLVACGEAAKTDVQLEAEGWVKNPAENGWIKKLEPDALSGASINPNPERQLEPEQVKELALEYLRGWEYDRDADGNIIWSYREMYQVATSYGGNPGISTVEYTLDPETMRLYSGNEKGTQKLNHMRENPYVELYWVKQIAEEDYVPGVNDYWCSYGVKFTGKVRFLEPDFENDEFVLCASRSLATGMGAEKWNAMGEDAQLAYLENVAPYLDFYVIDIEQVIVVSLWWRYNKDGMENDPRKLYDPTHIGFGKDVYQFYTVKR